MSTTTAAVPTGTIINNDPDFIDNRNHWWYSSEAYVVKFAILTSLFGLFVAYFLGGYIHAKRRVRKGKAPLAYHRWLLPRHVRAQFDPRYQQPYATYYQAQDGYAMQNYPPPPPAYNPNAPMPPAYGIPQGASKAMPSQMYMPNQGPASSSTPPPSEPPQGQSKPLVGLLSRFRR